MAAKRRSSDARSPPDASARWLLLIHQIPPKPDYFRVKVGKRLAKLGAVAVKRSVYVLPLTEGALEDLQWVAREIAAEGGEATVCRASFVEGLTDAQIEALFHSAREADYQELAAEIRALKSRMPRRTLPSGDEQTILETELGRLKRRLGEILALDFFHAPGRVPAEAALADVERRLARSSVVEGTSKRPTKGEFRGRVWVTRKNIHVDRIGSAWLVRRFIDPKATFKFVAGQGYDPKPDEVTFDMFDASFTHVGDKCTFEVLVDAFELRETGLRPLAEVVHDIDIKDGKFARAEAPGLAALIAGISLSERNDEPRLAFGERVFDALFEALRRKARHS
jgi:hypothetical protein